MKYHDYYKTLGVERSATQPEIRKAYRALARKFHPDVNKAKDAESRFKEISEAHEVLSDPEKRKLYDALGNNWKAGQDFRPPPGYENFDFGSTQGRTFRTGQGGATFGGTNGGSFNFGDFSDFFSTLFGGGFARAAGGGESYTFGGGEGATMQDIFGAEAQEGAARATRRRGSQTRLPRQEAEITLTVDDLIRGGKRTLTLETIGSDAAGQQARSTKTIHVTIPAGTTDGSLIRLADQGGAPGVDLFLRVRVVPDGRYKIEAFNLIMPLPVAPWDATLGAVVEVAVPDGSVKLRVPAGSQHGGRLRLRGKGLRKSKSERGDLIAEIQIVIPKELTAKEEKLWQELRDVSALRSRDRT